MCLLNGEGRQGTGPGEAQPRHPGPLEDAQPVDAAVSLGLLTVHGDRHSPHLSLLKQPVLLSDPTVYRWLGKPGCASVDT